MGIRITIGGYPFEASDYTVEEASTPLAGSDTSGGVGSISLTLVYPSVPLIGTRDTGWQKILEYGPSYFDGAAVELADSRKGYTLGRVDTTSTNNDATVTFTCSTRLGSLNAYNIQAQPFVGTLAQAFEYYCSLGNITTNVFVDPSIATQPVVFPGWNGELWFYLKQAAAAVSAEVSLVSGIVLLRPIRQRVAAPGRDTARSNDLGGTQLAQAIEVYKYDNRAISNELVYPPGGWSNDVEIITVNAGETIEQVIELSASVSSITQPLMQSFVAEDYTASSVYTIVGDDGLDVDPAMWAAQGGKLSVEINPDTTSLTVRLTGATDIPTTDGMAMSTTFSVALASDTSGSRYSTLRITGSGVAFDKTKLRVRTGITPQQTGTEVGVTIDNPFISSIDDAYKVGTKAARQYAGVVFRQSGTVLSVNRLGDTGDATYPTYAQVQAALKTVLGPTATYAQVKTYYRTTLGLTTYQDVKDYWFSQVQDDFDNQVFGNIAGARVWNPIRRRWFRIRTGTPSPGLISYTADDDLTHADIQGLWAGKTYDQVKALFPGMTYRQVEMAGMYNG